LASVAHLKGIAVHVGFDATADWGGVEFDVVILHHVLEHEYNPRAMVEHAAKSLCNGGLLFVEVPTFETPSWFIFGRYWGGLEFPVHLTLLRKQQIIDLLQDVGCVPIECKTRTLYGEVLRALGHRFPGLGERRRVERIPIALLAIVIQAGLAAVNALLRRGEAFSVVARREPSPNRHVESTTSSRANSRR